MRGTSINHINIITSNNHAYCLSVPGTTKFCHVHGGRRRDAQDQQATAFLDTNVICWQNSSSWKSVEYADHPSCPTLLVTDLVVYVSSPSVSFPACNFVPKSSLWLVIFPCQDQRSDSVRRKDQQSCCCAGTSVPHLPCPFTQTPPGAIRALVNSH